MFFGKKAKKKQEDWQREVILKPLFRLSLTDEKNGIESWGWEIKLISGKVYEAKRKFLENTAFEVGEGELFTAPGVGDVVYKIADGFLIQYTVKRAS